MAFLFKFGERGAIGTQAEGRGVKAERSNKRQQSTDAQRTNNFVAAGASGQNAESALPLKVVPPLPREVVAVDFY